MNRVSRKIGTLGAAGLLAIAGIGGVAVHSTAAHASGPPAAATASQATDTDQVQQEVQGGSQQDVAGSDKAETGAPTGPDTDTTQSQSTLDTP
jgi:hypothetical protein